MISVSISNMPSTCRLHVLDSLVRNHMSFVTQRIPFTPTLVERGLVAKVLRTEKSSSRPNRIDRPSTALMWRKIL